MAVRESTSGGFVGIGGKPDGGVVLGTEAKIVRSYQLGDSIVHEVDALLSPQLPWRFLDTMRLPGTS